MTNTSEKETGSSSRTSVIILNGFLGSGKTTLFRNLLAPANNKPSPVCAFVNDMSELVVEGELFPNTRIA
ncbi:MAG: GTP-binding protein [Acidobacteriota bacterium]